MLQCKENEEISEVEEDSFEYEEDEINYCD